jgi:hypothetical protein
MDLFLNSDRRALPFVCAAALFTNELMEIGWRGEMREVAETVRVLDVCGGGTAQEKEGYSGR